MTHRRSKSAAEESDQIGVFVPGTGSYLSEMSGDLWMLADDVGMEIWSQFNRLEEEPTSGAIRMDGVTGDVEKVIWEAVFDREDDTSIFRAGEFFRMLARELVLHDYSYYEVVTSRNPEAPEKILDADLLWLQRECLSTKGEEYVLHVPEEFSKLRKCPERIAIPRTKVVTFRLDQPWQSELNKIRECLPVLYKHRTQWMNDHMELASRTGETPREDFKKVVREYDVQNARLTRRVGWTGRNAWGEHIADFHLCTRLLRWYRFCADARDSILKSINEAIAIMFKESVVTPRMIIEGVPTASTIEQASDLLQNGDTKFNDILDIAKGIPNKPKSHAGDSPAYH